MVNGEHPYEKIGRINFERPQRPKMNRFVLIGIVVVMTILLRIAFPWVEPVCLMLPELIVLSWIASFGMEEALEEVIAFLRRLKKLF